MNADEFFQQASDFISKIHRLEATLNSFGSIENLTPAQHTILKILYLSGAQNLSSLSHCLNMNLPNSSREVRKLTGLNLVEKKQGAVDKRIIEIGLTEKGLSQVKELFAKMQKGILNRNKENWTDEVLQRCSDSMKQLEREFLGG